MNGLRSLDWTQPVENRPYPPTPFRMPNKMHCNGHVPQICPDRQCLQVLNHLKHFQGQWINTSGNPTELLENGFQKKKLQALCLSIQWGLASLKQFQCLEGKESHPEVCFRLCTYSRPCQSRRSDLPTSWSKELQHPCDSKRWRRANKRVHRWMANLEFNHKWGIPDSSVNMCIYIYTYIHSYLRVYVYIYIYVFIILILRFKGTSSFSQCSCWCPTTRAMSAIKKKLLRELRSKLKK